MQLSHVEPPLASPPVDQIAGKRYQLTADFDFLREEVMRDPYPLYRQLQEEQPVFWSAQMDAWVITRHEDVDGALKNPALFSSARIHKILYGYADRRIRGMPLESLLRPLVRRLAKIKMRGFVEMGTRFMWQNDPPEHTRLRKLMHQGFTASLVTKMRPLIAERANALIDKFCARGSADFMADFAVPFPAQVVADIFGVSEDWEQLHHWENDLKLFLGARRGSAQDASQAALRSVAEMRKYFTAKIRARRGKPGDDLISRLAAAQDEGFYFDDRELCANLMVTLGAAQITTQDMLGNGLYALLRNPEQLEILKSQRELLLRGIDEVIRYDGPVQLTNRVLTSDHTLRGCLLRKGQMVYLIRGAANRDPARFPEPDRFDVRRSTQGHVAFGSGIHYCIGAALARAEGDLAFGAVFDRMPQLRLDAERPVQWRADNLQFRGLARLPVCFEPTPARGANPT
jgi:cytochrome P450